MDFLSRFKYIVNKNIVLQTIYEKSKAFVRIVPFYVIEESADIRDVSNIGLKMNANELSVMLLGPSDMRQISETPGVKDTEEALIERLNNRWICLGLKHRGNVAAHMWCNLMACDSKLLSFRLNHGEAYLTDARTLEEYRGKGLAPYLRVQFYQHLRNIGYYKLYSITEYFNEAAMNFKRKLGARPISLYVHVCLLKRYMFCILLRRYNNRSSNMA
mgnify:FL=1